MAVLVSKLVSDEFMNVPEPREFGDETWIPARDQIGIEDVRGTHGRGEH
ncbi:hypothetical protein [Phytoactinopolyspora halotolerans]|uniref:Uncharacterized protein n=1 Tax=Phytoactinopolyspora halotolerans TaxID=1981512 RepID=A0A6L9S6W4_9ACTN|nr:hypothetical protein [Phytoactinopolyspora halotolerans]NEE00799.1 hypothetical protein [Phytoactinopolyspora halotolerans]